MQWEQSVGVLRHTYLYSLKQWQMQQWAQGMPRKQAYQFAAQSVLGSARMVLETGMHPGELKDMVCSPAGTTIEGVRTLEKAGFRSAVFEALQACADKGKKM